MCVGAPESTTNSRSSGLFETTGVDIPLTSPGTWNVVFVRILELVNIFAKFHATLRAQRSWCKVSSCDLSSNFGAQGLRSWGSPPSVLAFEFGAGEDDCPFRTSATVSRGWFMTETTWVSFRTLSMWFPLKTFSHFPRNVGFLSFLIFGHCSSLNNFVLDSEVLSSHHLVNTKSHRSL